MIPAQLRQKLLTAQPRQHQVEQNQIRADIFEQHLRLRAGIRTQYRIALPLQDLLLQISDRLVIINNQN